MTLLTEKDVDGMTELDVRIILAKIQFLMCNIDYTTNEGSIQYGSLEKNETTLLRKLDGEY